MLNMPPPVIESRFVARIEALPIDMQINIYTKAQHFQDFGGDSDDVFCLFQSDFRLYRLCIADCRFDLVTLENGASAETWLLGLYQFDQERPLTLRDACIVLNLPITPPHQFL